MEKDKAAEQQGQEQWIQELLALSEKEQMTPKQRSILQAAIDTFSEKGVLSSRHQ